MTETTCTHENKNFEPADPAVGIMDSCFYCEDCGAELVSDEDGNVMTVTEAEETKQARVLDPNDPWNVSAPLPAGIFPSEEPPF